MKRTIIGITIAVMLLFVLFGCTQQETNQENNNPTNGEINTENTNQEEVINDTMSEIIDETQEPNIGEMY